MYSRDMNIGTWYSLASGNANGIINAVQQGYSAYKKWYDYSYGQSTSGLAVALNTDVNHINDLQSSFAAFNDFYSILTNQSAPVMDRLTIFCRVE